jgi:hypothetical protein
MHRRSLAVLVAVLVGVLAPAASAAPSSGPTIHTVSACTEELPFGIEGSVTGLQPNTSYGVRATFASGGTVSTIFTTDDAGSSGLGGVRGPEPFELRVVIWLNPDGDFDQDAGEPTVLDQVLVIDQPCAPAHLKQPASKEQCKDGGWRSYPGFKSQGDCVSFVNRSAPA